MSEKLANRLVPILALLGAAVALWLVKTHLDLSLGGASLQSNCTLFGAQVGGSGCEEIALSGFSKIGFFPLAGIALGYFIGQLLLFFWAAMNPQARYEPTYASYGLASLALFVTVTMMFISTFVVKSFCIGCACLWVINLLFWCARFRTLDIPFSQAVSANFELFRHGKMQLFFPRVYKAILTVGVAVLVVAGIAGAMESSAESSAAGDVDRAVARFKEGTQVFLPNEALLGERAKGADTDKAVLQIVKFADFQCPGCRRSAQVFKPFFLRNKAKVRLVYRNFPLDGACNPYVPNGGHFMACQSAIAGICAAKQDKFFEYHDRIFDRQDLLSASLIDEVAKEIGLDSDKFNACRSSQEAKDELTKDMNWAESIGLRSTPTYVINGHKVEGGFSPEQWEAVLKAVEAEKGR